MLMALPSLIKYCEILVMMISIVMFVIFFPLLAFAQGWSQAICPPGSGNCLQNGYDAASSNNALESVENNPSATQVPCSGSAGQYCQPYASQINSTWIKSSYDLRLKLQSGWSSQSQKIILKARSEYSPLSVCSRGGCFLSLSQKKQLQNSPFMTQIAVALMQGAGHSLSAMRVFSGRRVDCMDTGSFIGSNKCCSGGQGALQTFWGQGCSANAQTIISAKNHGRASFLGSWQSCSQSLPWGGCLKSSTHYAFCIWPNQVTRIIQEQGRAQLRQNIYSDCRGFLLNPNEVAKINFNSMDFSSVHLAAPTYP